MLTPTQLDQMILRVPDYPKPGIVFQDITPLLGDAEGFNSLIQTMVNPYLDSKVTHVLGIEARGFLLASAMAYQLGAGLVPVRKIGKLPRPTISRTYDLEYGTAEIEMHLDALPPGSRTLIVDDVLATGGTLGALLEILAAANTQVVGISVISEIPGLDGRTKLMGLPLSIAIP
ncbi:MAG: adenine phosphoribosyltransferase [Candidatus Nanopelagicales bacterium]